MEEFIRFEDRSRILFDVKSLEDEFDQLIGNEFLVVLAETKRRNAAGDRTVPMLCGRRAFAHPSQWFW